MKKLIFFIILTHYFMSLFANGICIVDPDWGTILPLQQNLVNVAVENQVAVVTNNQTFINNTNVPYTVQYAFPLPLGASATNLRWLLDDEWIYADITEAQSGGLPEDIQYSLISIVLGDNPIYFTNENLIIPPNSTFTVEIEYVQFLEYDFGYVNFSYPNLCQWFLDSPIGLQSFEFSLTSLRTIEEIELTSHSAELIENDGNFATISYEQHNNYDYDDYEVVYSLSSDELGLFSMSSFMPPETVPDEHGNGFFTFFVEPNTSANIIDKVFTLIIDRSGSMSGQKIEQARNAASFIVNNLNEGDKFNIVDFSDSTSSLFEEHLLFNSLSQEIALEYIANINATGGTNMSSAFDLAIPQFDTASDDTANIIIFLTDGEATEGITETDLLAEHVFELILTTDTRINLFTFGIGHWVNYQLLSLLGNQNNGFAYFLEDNNVENVISDFYTQIKNPVILNIELEFTPQFAVEECYPIYNPNLYLGKQLVISGRYSEVVPVNIQLSGSAFGNFVQYDYELNLSDSINTNYQFLTKIWAKQKIEHLIIEYYTYPEDSSEAEAIYDEIVQISIDFGVITPFTSFSGPGVGFEEEELEPENDVPVNYEIVGNCPNPFNPSTEIRFNVFKQMNKNVAIKIFNVKGQLVRILGVHVNQPGQYQVHWDGTDMSGEAASSGLYFYIIDFGEEVLSSKMMLIK